MSERYDGVERRRDRRFYLRVPLHVAAADGIFRKLIHLESHDISAGGVSFETSQELTLEAESQIIFSRVGDLSGTYTIRGRVVWTRLLPASGRFLVGVRFTGYEGISREELLARMEEWAKG